MNRVSAEFVLQSIPVFKDLVDEHSLVPEKSFDDYFENSSDIDNAPKKITGLQLNELTTNRQRSMIINHPNWLSIVKARKARKAELEAHRHSSKRDQIMSPDGMGENHSKNATAKKPQSVKICGGPSCEQARQLHIGEYKEKGSANLSVQ
mmetsp:Transcript_1605/g.2578  ORF Transcript_1605/g.2578 Transcript_1605/m.2578 type:complete len:150 (+) Transcript_1605:305-754(+)